MPSYVKRWFWASRIRANRVGLWGIGIPPHNSPDLLLGSTLPRGHGRWGVSGRGMPRLPSEPAGRGHSRRLWLCDPTSPAAWLSCAVASALDAQAVARLRITPAVRTVAVGDSLRLVVEPLDQAGNVVSGATIRFGAQGGRFQGSVDSLGWVRAGSPGTVPISVSAMTPNGRPVAERVEVRIVAGPAARIAIAPSVSKLLVGQRMRLDETVLTATGDAREENVAWSSSNPSAIRVADGLITAVGPGNATITARAGAAQATVALQVIPSAGVSVDITPARAQGRQGDVIRFAITVKDARGTPTPPDAAWP